MRNLSLFIFIILSYIGGEQGDLFSPHLPPSPRSHADALLPFWPQLPHPCTSAFCMQGSNLHHRCCHHHLCVPPGCPSHLVLSPHVLWGLTPLGPAHKEPPPHSWALYSLAGYAPALCTHQSPGSPGQAIIIPLVDSSSSSSWSSAPGASLSVPPALPYAGKLLIQHPSAGL